VSVTSLTVPMPEVPSAVWVHPGLEVRDSPIAERGLFATDGIVAGTVVIRFGGRTVTTAALHELFARAAVAGTYVDTIAIDEDRHLVLPAGSSAHFGNHSCDPSTWLAAGSLELVARRDLVPGDEVTSDYGVTSDDDSFRMVCTCGAASCRGIVTGSDWMRPELQALHEHRWPPGLQRKIDASAPT